MVLSMLNTQQGVDVSDEDTSSAAGDSTRKYNSQSVDASEASAPIRVALLTGGCDKPYAIGLADSLAARDISLDIIGSDLIDSPELHSTSNIRFLNYRGDQRPASKGVKTIRLLKYYLRLIRYAAFSEASIFHILWHTRVLEYFDRTFFLLYLKLLGKQVAFTAHNVNAGRRDGTDSVLNRLTLTFQYRLVDHIFVHTESMREELINEFGANRESITVLSYPINDVIPDTGLDTLRAKARLGITAENKTVLFFGKICAYKGIEYLLTAFQHLLVQDPTYRLIIAGEVNKGEENYLLQIEEVVSSQNGKVIPVVHYIPDEDIEIYFKAADVLVLPYKDIFQSGVLFVAYSFGLPVIASNVGSFRETIVEGKTGFICKACDALDLAGVINHYFESALFEELGSSRASIREFAATHHSSEAAAVATECAYVQMQRR